MNGKFLFDTNAVINLLNKNDLSLPEEQLNLIYCISIITELELLSSSNLNKLEEDAIIDICSISSIINIDADIKDKTIKLRKKYKLKLPDAVICATAKSLDIPLVSDDKTFEKVEEIKLLTLSECLKAKNDE